MIAGILGAVTWALETLILGTAMAMAPFLSSEQAMLLAPFTSTFLHDFFSAVWACIYNGARGNLNQFFKALKSRNGRFVVLGAVIGGPLGMTGYVLSINNMGPSIGAVASAAYPAIGAALAFFFLKEKMQWYRWLLLFITLLGVYGLSYSPEIAITNFWLGFTGTLMCAFGWGTEAVILAKSMQGTEVTDEIALQIRQTTSAIFYGFILLPLLDGWNLTFCLFSGSGLLIPTIAMAALFATISYLFYYRAIAQIGAAKAMAVNITYAAWSIVFSVVFFKDTGVLNLTTIICTLIVLVCGILAATDYKDLLKKESSL